ncbi:hypothetical protein SDC9_192761 [bioreactor metagenome]|uniref:Uncharacterized protein n=1 Tax=bioreactor metagenome TaxID=1076179 RepID=A0A645IA48_9ZZZZ
MDIGVEALGGLVTCSFMTITMTGYFMTGRNDLANDAWIALRNPSKRKKSRFGCVLIEHGENAVNILLNAAFPAIPFAFGNVRCQRRYLEIILDIDRQRINRGG